MTPPNVILIQADDHGTLDAGCYGTPDLRTPALDMLAARGTLFTQAYGHTVCCPSRAALLTGRYPQRCGINDWCSNHPSDERGVGIASDAPTLPSVLRSHGYRTALFGKWHLGSRPGSRPRECGFDEFFGHLGGFIDNYSHRFLHSKPRQPPFHDLWENDAEVFADGCYFPDLVTERALRFLEREHCRPFYLHLAPNLPHYPYQPDADLAEASVHLPEPRASYAAMVATLDRRIAKILEAVDRLGLREHTLVCYTSDHGHSTEDFSNWGESYGARGGGGEIGQWRGAKGSFFEGGIRVPTILSLPGTIGAGEVRHQLVTNMDLMPTILDACGVPRPEADGALDGRSLWPLLDNPAVSTTYGTVCLQWRGSWMVRAGDWKLMFNGIDTTGLHSRHPEGSRELGQWHLASLVADPPEATNFTDAQPEITTQLREAYEDWAEDVFGAR